MLIILCIILVLICLYLYMIMPRMLHRADKSPFMGVLYAHRGLHDNTTAAPENSLAAFLKAVEAGYGIEMDVQLTKDKVPVVFHDFTLSRACGVEGRLADYTYEELMRFSLFDSEQKIPTFEEVLKLVDGKVPLIIEYKIPGRSAEVCPIADKILQDYKGVYCIESFNPLGVLWYRKNRGEIMRGQLSENFIKSGEKELSRLLYFSLHHLLFNFLTKPDFIAYNHSQYRDLSRWLCKNLYGCLAVAWTIRSEETLLLRQKDFDLFIFENFLKSCDIK